MVVHIDFCTFSGGRVRIRLAETAPTRRFIPSSLVCVAPPSSSFVFVASMSGYQFSPFEIGQIKAHMYHGFGAAQIARILVKADGKSQWSDKAVQNQIVKLEEEPTWRGERREGSRRPRKTTAKQDAEIVRLLLKLRGEQKVTVAVLRKFLTWARTLSDIALEERLRDAGLAYLRRRRKCLVPTYTELIEDYFPRWLKGCSYLVQDFERCLHAEEPLSSLSGIGVELVEDYPKCSQDFNAIENAWKMLRDRLDENTHHQSRKQHMPWMCAICRRQPSRLKSSICCRGRWRTRRSKRIPLAE